MRDAARTRSDGRRKKFQRSGDRNIRRAPGKREWHPAGPTRWRIIIFVQFALTHNFAITYISHPHIFGWVIR